jgi:hypothetical protein
VADEFRRVRDIDPRQLLGAHPHGKDLQPYLPRDVDSALDEALASPGLVLVLHDSASGARRTVYEALLRNLPDNHLAVDYDEGLNYMPAEGVLWLDVRHASVENVSSTARLVRQWVNFGYAVLIINHNFRLLEPLKAELARANPKVVEITNQLSGAEQAAAQQVDGQFAGETVDDLITTADVALPAVRHAAGYHADTDAGQDWLGITRDVHMLADLVVSRHIEPPLSIGLFGDWGSGKSFFMRQMRDRVAFIAGAAKSAERKADRRGPGVSTYCSSVRQITFNAWHYAEANLWASLATHIFDNLATEDDKEVLQQRIKDLAEKRQAEHSLLTKLSMVRLQRRLMAAQLDKKPAPRRLGREDRALVTEVMGAATTEDVREFATNLRGFSAEVWQTWTTVLRRSPYALAMVGIGIVLGVGLWFLARSSVWLALVPLLASAGEVFTRARAAMGRIRRAAEGTDVEQKLAELDEEAAQLERAVAELSTQHEAMAFAKSRHADYQQHLGIVSLLRRDLETFAEILKSEKDGVERIVLYIDDLDRCPPAVVIKVLEAVHLLVALPVFVVVVAVDPAWLHQAIRQHYETVRPERYLEKIFQIPFQVQAMEGSGFLRLVRGLAGRDVPAVPEFEPPSPVVPDPGPLATEQDQIESSYGLVPTTLAPRRPAEVELRPRQLEISEAELEFMSGLAPLVSTPRAAKRLVNLYRLVRARLLDRDVDAFVASDEYRAVLVLLATAGEPGRADVELPDRFYEQWLPLVRRFSFEQAERPPIEAGGRSPVI